MKISFTSLDKLTRWESFQFLYDVVDFIDSHSEGMSELFNSKFAELDAAFKIYDQALVQEGRTAPEELIKAEERRDFAIRKIYSLLREYSDFPFDQNKENAAKSVLEVFKPYGTGNSIAAMAQDSETAVLTNLIQDFEKEGPEDNLDLLGLISIKDELKNDNLTFVAYQQQRRKDNAEFVGGVVKTARTDAQNEFISFVDLVNALAIVEGEEKYAALKQTINSLHKDIVNRAKQRTKKTEEETEEVVIEETNNIN